MSVLHCRLGLRLTDWVVEERTVLPRDAQACLSDQGRFLLRRGMVAISGISRKPPSVMQIEKVVSSICFAKKNRSYLCLCPSAAFFAFPFSACILYLSLFISGPSHQRLATARRLCVTAVYAHCPVFLSVRAALRALWPSVSLHRLPLPGVVRGRNRSLGSWEGQYGGRWQPHPRSVHGLQMFIGTGFNGAACHMLLRFALLAVIGSHFVWCLFAGLSRNGVAGFGGCAISIISA